MSETFRTEADVMVSTAGHVDDTNNYVQFGTSTGFTGLLMG